MCGGFVGLMRFFIISRDDVLNLDSRRPAKQKAVTNARPNCPLCSYSEVHLEHCLWCCPARDWYVYPLPKRPTCPLQARLAWPSHDNDECDLSIIQLFCKIGSHLLEVRLE